MRPVHFALGFAIAIVALAYFPVRFALTFELFGNPVRTETRWLGPTPRDAGACVWDVGKVNFWQCSSTEVFSDHQYGCTLWLRFFEYTDS